MDEKIIMAEKNNMDEKVNMDDQINMANKNNMDEKTILFDRTKMDKAEIEKVEIDMNAVDQNESEKTKFNIVKMSKSYKIGIFDSGLGGLSVLHTIRQILPNESFIYLGDSKNAPYGVKSKEQVLELSKNICDFMINEGVKAIVIACNTATSAAVENLRNMYDIPIIGMEPAVKPALKQTTEKVYVFATEMTLKEDKFQKLIEAIDDGYRIIKTPAPSWVDCVENHLSDEVYVKKCVFDFLHQYAPKARCIVLGCTHFIFLKKYILEFYQNQIEIFDGNIGTAIQLKNTLNSMDLLNEDYSYGIIDIYNTKSDEFIQKSYELLSILEEEIK